MFERKLHWGRVKSRGKQAIFLFGFAAGLALVTSCGSSSSSTATPTITVSCTPTDVTVLNTSQCTASVLNLSSTLVNWSISPSTSGSISPGGLYTAPSTVPTSNVVTVTATSQVQSTVTATQGLTIEPAVAIDHVTCVDPNTSISPSPLVVASQNQLDCTALTSAGATVAVNWTVSNATAGLAGNVGTISSLGIYTAPLVPPPGQTVTITGTSQSVSTIAKTATVTVVFGSAVVRGNYVFSTSGHLPTGAFWARTGSFSAGGGSLLGISEDTNQGGSPNVVKTARLFTGSYSIGPDGRGTMQFCEDTSSACTAGAATAFFRIVVVSPGQFELVEFSSPATTSATIVAGGEMIQQDPSLIQPGIPISSVLFGAYSFNFAGVSTSASAESVVGEFSSNGFGAIAAGSTSPPTPGAMDIDAGGATPLAATSYSISTSAVGTVILNGLKFDFYPISSSRAKFIEIDQPSTGTAPDSILLGDAYKQQSSSTCGWSTNVALSGPIVLETLGAASGFEVADVGSFTANNGNATNISIDENSAGMYTPPAGSQSGTYAIDPLIKCSRGTLSIPGHSYVFYVISPSSAVLQETTSGTTAHGLLAPAQSGSFADGSYAFRMQGTNAAGAAGQEEDLLGQFTSVTTGGATAWNGTLDLNDFGVTQMGLPITNGVYTASSGLRSTATMPIGNPVTTTRNLVLYMVSPTLFYVLGTDATGTALGIIGNQF